MSIESRLRQLEDVAQRRDGEECVNRPWYVAVRAIYQRLLDLAGHKPGTPIDENCERLLLPQLKAIDRTIARLDEGCEPDPVDLSALPEALWPENAPVVWEILLQGQLVPMRLAHTVKDLSPDDIEQLIPAQAGTSTARADNTTEARRRNHDSET